MANLKVVYRKDIIPLGVEKVPGGALHEETDNVTGVEQSQVSAEGTNKSVSENNNTHSPTPLVSSEPPRYQSQLPNRYRKRDTDQSQTDEREAAREERRLKARETRRTRRTIKIQQQQQSEQQQEKELLEKPMYTETHSRIEIDSESDASSIDENYDVASIAEEIEESLTWRGRMQIVLHNHWLHLVIVFLVALDAFIVIFELLLDIGAFNNRLCRGEGPIEQAQFCHYEMPEECAPHASLILMNRNISASPGAGTEDLCHCGFREGLFVCLKAMEVSGVNPAVVLHVFSLIILSLFMVEIIVKIIAFRLKYFTHKFEVFDGIVVVISWTLDVASIVQEEAFEAAALLIVLRLWRVIRIVNGAVLTSKTQSDNQLHKAKHEAKKVIHAFHKAQDRMDEFEEENIKLKKELSQLKAETASKPYKRLRSNSDESDDDTKL